MPTNNTRSPDDFWADVVLACLAAGHSDERAIRSANTFEILLGERRAAETLTGDPTMHDGELSVDKRTGCAVERADLSWDGVRTYPAQPPAGDPTVTEGRDGELIIDSPDFDEGVCEAESALREPAQTSLRQLVDELHTTVKGLWGKRTSECLRASDSSHRQHAAGAAAALFGVKTRLEAILAPGDSAPGPVCGVCKGVGHVEVSHDGEPDISDVDCTPCRGTGITPEAVEPDLLRQLVADAERLRTIVEALALLHFGHAPDSDPEQEQWDLWVDAAIEGTIDPASRPLLPATLSRLQRINDASQDELDALARVYSVRYRIDEPDALRRTLIGCELDRSRLVHGTSRDALLAEWAASNRALSDVFDSLCNADADIVNDPTTYADAIDELAARVEQRGAFFNYLALARVLCEDVGTQDETGQAYAIREEMDAPCLAMTIRERKLANHLMSLMGDASEVRPAHVRSPQTTDENMATYVAHELQTQYGSARTFIGDDGEEVGVWLSLEDATTLAHSLRGVDEGAEALTRDLDLQAKLEGVEEALAWLSATAANDSGLVLNAFASRVQKIIHGTFEPVVDGYAVDGHVSDLGPWTALSSLTIEAANLLKGKQIEARCAGDDRKLGPCKVMHVFGDDSAVRILCEGFSLRHADLAPWLIRTVQDTQASTPPTQRWTRGDIVIGRCTFSGLHGARLLEINRVLLESYTTRTLAVHNTTRWVLIHNDRQVECTVGCEGETVDGRTWSRATTDVLADAGVDDLGAEVAADDPG